MELDRAAKYGTIGALGVIPISLGTIGLSRVVWANRVSGFEGRAIDTVTIIGIEGTALTILFLFVVIGAFIDAELEAREPENPGE